MPANIHCSAAKSVSNRTKSVPTVEVQDADWGGSLPHGPNGGLKACVTSAMRCTDAALGISSHGLTRCRNSKVLTKPHHLVARFALYQLMRDLWHETEGDDDAKASAVDAAANAMWVTRILNPHMFIRVLGSPGDLDNDSMRMLIMTSGPFAVRALKLVYNEETQCFALASKSYSAGCTLFLLEKMENVEVGQVFNFYINTIH